MTTVTKPIGSYGLEYADTHIVRRVNIETFRAVLRDVRLGKSPIRSGQKLGRPALSKLTAPESEEGPPPVNSQTIKNIEDGLIKDPGIVTVARLVEAAGITLSAFFAQIEGLKTSSLDVKNPPGRDVRVQGAKGADSLSVPPTPTHEAQRELYRKIGNLYLEAAASGQRVVAQTERAKGSAAARRGKRRTARG